MKYLTIFTGLLFATIVASGAGAGTSEISKVRQAAINKMQQKLGTIRGSIKPDTKHIFLTAAMIDQLKPIKEQAQPLNNATVTKFNPIDLDPSRKSSRQLANEIYRSVGLEKVDHGTITHSIDSDLLGTSNIYDLERSVDQMLLNN